MSIDAVTVRCLCHRHNSALSEADQAAIDTFNAIREWHRLFAVRRVPLRRSVRWPHEFFRVDGCALERWAFKTTCNAAYIDGGGWLPSDQLARLAFGSEEPRARSGISVFGDVGDKADFSNDDQVFAFVRHKTTAEIAASLFRFHGLNFICTWDRAVDELLPLPLPDVSGGSVIHHLNVFNAKPENVALCFDWSGKFKPSRKTIALRAKYPGTPR